MESIQLRELHRNTAEYAGKEVTVRGWVRTNRNSNKFGFIELNDGSFFTPVQIVYEADKDLKNHYIISIKTSVNNGKNTYKKQVYNQQ